MELDQWGHLSQTSFFQEISVRSSFSKNIPQTRHRLKQLDATGTVSMKINVIGTWLGIGCIVLAPDLLPSCTTICLIFINFHVWMWEPFMKLLGGKALGQSLYHFNMEHMEHKNTKGTFLWCRRLRWIWLKKKQTNKTNWKKPCNEKWNYATMYVCCLSGKVQPQKKTNKKTRHTSNWIGYILCNIILEIFILSSLVS